MEYKITDESKEAAKRTFRQMMTGPHSYADCFDAAIGVLLVPVEEEGWVESSHKTLSWKGDIRFTKGKYQLIRWGSWCWKLYPLDAPEWSDSTQIGHLSIDYSPSEAQAWADQIIKEREAEENPADDPKSCYACLGAPGMPHTCKRPITWQDDWM